MTRRLQVLFDDKELAEIQRVARRRGQTTADFVRDALRSGVRAVRDYPDPEPKLRAVREAMAHAYSAGDVADINAEIERGYLEDRPSNADADAT